MSIYEYNEEYVRKSLFEDGMETGYNKGFDTGFDSGQQNGAAHKLVQNVDSVMKKLGVSLEQACEILDTTIEEYENAKKY